MKRSITIIFILLICVSSIFCLDTKSTKVPNGTYLTILENRLVYLYFDNETEGFVFYYELWGEDEDDISSYYLYGDYNKSYSDEKDYTLFSYDYEGNFIGSIPLSSVSTLKGIKITLGRFFLIGVELDKISNTYIPLDELGDFISKNNLVYPKPKTNPNTTSVKYNKVLDGSYLNVSKKKITYFFVDKDTDGFIFYEEYLEENKYRLLFGSISPSYSDEKKYTLYCYSEDFDFVGSLQMTNVFKDKGIKITMNPIGVIGLEMEKISNQKMTMEDISNYIVNNREKYNL